MQEEPVYRENVDTLQSSSYPPHPSAYPPHPPTYPPNPHTYPPSPPVYPHHPPTYPPRPPTFSPSPPAYPHHPPTYPPHPPTSPFYSHSPSYPVQNKPIYPSYADHHRTGYSYNKQSEHVYHPTHPQPVLPPPPSSLHTPGPGEDIGGNTQGFTNILATVPRGKNIKQLFHQTLNVIILFLYYIGPEHVYNTNSCQISFKTRFLFEEQKIFLYFYM